MDVATVLKHFLIPKWLGYAQLELEPIVTGSIRASATARIYTWPEMAASTFVRTTYFLTLFYQIFFSGVCFYNNDINIFLIVLENRYIVHYIFVLQINMGNIF
jgi:hypothetical protein